MQYLTGLSVFLLQGLVDNFTQNRIGESLVFQLVFILMSCDTTFNKILSTKGSFSGTNCTEIVFVFGQGSAEDPAGGATMLP